jgi:chromosome segregation ATPase
MPSRESAVSRFVRGQEPEEALEVVVSGEELLDRLERQAERIAELELQLGEASRARHSLGRKLARERSVRDQTSAELHAATARAVRLEERLDAVSEELRDAEDALERCRGRGLARLRRRSR